MFLIFSAPVRWIFRSASSIITIIINIIMISIVAIVFVFIFIFISVRDWQLISFE